MCYERELPDEQEFDWEDYDDYLYHKEKEDEIMENTEKTIPELVSEIKELSDKIIGGGK